MVDRVKLLVQKRTSLKSQITSLSNLIDKNKIDIATLRLRYARVTRLHQAFEEFNDELIVLDPNVAHDGEFENVQERYFALASRIETMINSEGTSRTITDTPGGTPRSNSTEIATVIKKRRIKLPEAPLPKFDGRYENWLSFKNAFNNMIGMQSDLSDVDKLHYLKAALVGDAANKTNILAIEGVNYTQA